jgi:hypothetical protein
MKTILLTAASLLAALHVQASLIASDNAGNAPYATWDNGDNGGSGFLPWESIGNEAGGGFGGGFISTGNAAVNIGTGGSNAAFGVYGNSTGVGQAIRLFDGALTLGQIFSVDLDNQGVDNGGTVGFGLRNSTGENRFEFYFVGGQVNYTIHDSAGPTSSGVPWTAAGLSLALNLTGADSYSFTINGGSPITGTLGGTAGTGIDRVRLSMPTAARTPFSTIWRSRFPNLPPARFSAWV